MTRFASALAVGALLSTTPALAQEEKRLLPDLQELEREAQTAIVELLAVLGPLVERLSLFVDDLPAYEAPVMLPNGDILIRRKPDPALPPATDAPGDAEIET